jgi:hypothetical protein
MVTKHIRLAVLKLKASEHQNDNLKHAIFFDSKKFNLVQ